MNREDIFNESCLTCKKYDGEKHWDKGEKFCPHYPDKMSLYNYDIIGGYRCEHYEHKELVMPMTPNGAPVMKPILIIDLTKYNTFDSVVELLKRFYDDEGNLSLDKKY